MPCQDFISSSGVILPPLGTRKGAESESHAAMRVIHRIPHIGINGGTILWRLHLTGWARCLCWGLLLSVTHNVEYREQYATHDVHNAAKQVLTTINFRNVSECVERVCGREGGGRGEEETGM